MDIRQLEMFSALVECGGYSKAGEHLHVSHSAIHRQIRMLESELCDRLVVRAGRRIKLTKTGQTVLEHVRRICQDIARLRQEVDDLNHLRSGHLRIGTGTTMAVLFLPPILDEFRKKFPGIKVEVATETAGHVIQDIHDGKVDLGIIFSPSDIPKGSQSPQFELLYKEELVVAIGKGHPLARKEMASLHQLLNFPLVTYSKTSHLRRAIDRLLESAGVVPNLTMEVENDEAIEKMIEDNKGIAFISKRRAVRDKIHHIEIADHPLFVDVAIALPRTGYVSRAVKEFANMCRDASRALAS